MNSNLLEEEEYKQGTPQDNDMLYQNRTYCLLVKDQQFMDSESLIPIEVVTKGTDIQVSINDQGYISQGVNYGHRDYLMPS